MEPKVVSPAQSEERIAAYIREGVLEEIDRIGNLNEVAGKLAVSRVGVESLMAREAWDIQTAFRVAEGLGLPAVSALEEVASRYSTNGHGHGGETDT